MNTVRMTAGDYYIADACITYDNYYDNFLMREDWPEWGMKLGSTAIRSTGGDGGGYVFDMNNNIVGQYGIDAGNIAVVPAKCVQKAPPSHYGLKVHFDKDFDVVFHHDAMTVGGKYRVRHYRSVV